MDILQIVCFCIGAGAVLVLVYLLHDQWLNGG